MRGKLQPKEMKLDGGSIDCDEYSINKIDDYIYYKAWDYIKEE